MYNQCTCKNCICEEKLGIEFMLRISRLYLVRVIITQLQIYKISIHNVFY